MARPLNQQINWVVCSILNKIIQGLLDQGIIEGSLHVFDSALHMKPTRLASHLRNQVAELESTQRPIVAVVGLCCPHVDRLLAEHRAVRIAGRNCYEMLLGDKTYRALSKQRSFFILNEWWLRWDEIMGEAMGGSAQVADDMLRDMAQQFVYLQVSGPRSPNSKLDVLAQRLKIPVRRQVVDLQEITGRLLDARDRAIERGRA